MSLAAIEFAFFLPAVLAAYWLLPRRARVQNAFLLLASYVFYATWNVRLVPLLAFSTVADFAIGRFLGARPLPGADEPIPHGRHRARRIALGLSLAVNLGVLAFFKYAGFFAASLNGLLETVGLDPGVPALRILLPLGLSFYSLQKLGYVLDVYYGRRPACQSLLAFGVFAGFFPQLISGPISRAHQLIPQLERPRRLTHTWIAGGAQAFLVGFVLKAFIADVLAAQLVNPVFADAARFDTSTHWLALFGYAGQIFGDFAGYSLMAIGTGRLLGIELPENFRYPFLSTSLMEFWRRWHITLNMWLFDYIYGPLITSRGWWRGRLDLGLMLVFLASGLWHGSTGTFVLWGFLHGLGMVANRRWDEFYRGMCRRDRSWVAVRAGGGYRAAAWVLTQGFFLVTLVPFRTPTLSAAAEFTAGLLGAAGSEGLPGNDPVGLITLVLAVILLAAYYLLQVAPFARLRERFAALPDPLRGIAYGLALLFLALFLPVTAGTFIYAQF